MNTSAWAARIARIPQRPGSAVETGVPSTALPRAPNSVGSSTRRVGGIVQRGVVLV